MTTQIRRADYPDYQSYIDAIAEPVGGATNPAVWDEVEQAQGPTAGSPRWRAFHTRPRLEPRVRHDHFV